MGMSDFYAGADKRAAMRTLEAAFDAGINLVDTADFYGAGENELLLGQAIGKKRHDLFVQVKFGVSAGPCWSFRW